LDGTGYKNNSLPGIKIEGMIPGYRKPYAFTEHEAIMAANVLNSQNAA
jgi:hypothetical protein